MTFAHPTKARTRNLKLLWSHERSKVLWSRLRKLNGNCDSRLVAGVKGERPRESVPESALREMRTELGTDEMRQSKQNCLLFFKKKSKPKIEK